MEQSRQVDRQEPRLRWRDVGPDLRAFAGDIEAIYAAIDRARQSGRDVRVVSTAPGRAAGSAVVTVRFLPRQTTDQLMPMPRPAPVPRERGAVASAALGAAIAVLVSAVFALLAGVVWLVVSVCELFAANFATIVGASAVTVVVVGLVTHRGCKIYVTHIRR